jgi:hypothetical protein
LDLPVGSDPTPLQTLHHAIAEQSNLYQSTVGWHYGCINGSLGSVGPATDDEFRSCTVLKRKSSVSRRPYLDCERKISVGASSSATWVAVAAAAAVALPTVDLIQVALLCDRVKLEFGSFAV